MRDATMIRRMRFRCAVAALLATVVAPLLAVVPASASPAELAEDAVPNDPYYADQYYLPEVGAPQAWDVSRGSPTILVAVVGDAIDATHPDLAGRIASTHSVLDVPCSSPAYSGTEVAGLVGAIPNNGYGIAGIAWNVRIIGIEAGCGGWTVAGYGYADNAKVAEGIDLAVSLGVDVIHLSAAQSDVLPALENAVRNAITAGVVIVAPTGYCCIEPHGPVRTPLGPSYPAAYDGVIAVTSNAGGSVRGTWTEMIAPGLNLRTLCRCLDGTTTVDGSTAAAALVTGAIVLLLAREPGLSVEEVRQRLFGSSDQVIGLQWGRLNAARLVSPHGGGYATVTADGVVDAFGDGRDRGDLAGVPLNQPIVGATAPPFRDGYWLVASDGGIFAFGDAGFFGSTGAIRLNQPIVGMASTPTGEGYWLVASDGGIFAFGDAGFFGSTGAIRLNQPIVGMASTSTGAGYWLVASDGGMFTFGDAPFHGSTGAITLNKPIVGMSPVPLDTGYRLVARDGGVFPFGGGWFHGSSAGRHSSPTVALLPG